MKLKTREFPTRQARDLFANNVTGAWTGCHVSDAGYRWFAYWY